jgi:hypothetical protein
MPLGGTATPVLERRKAARRLQNGAVPANAAQRRSAGVVYQPVQNKPPARETKASEAEPIIRHRPEKKGRLNVAASQPEDVVSNI